MTTRILLAAGAMIGMAAFAPLPAQAAQGPWCAVQETGPGFVTEDCHYRSFDRCRSQVIAGNRGFCSQNPRWAGWYSHAPRRRY